MNKRLTAGMMLSQAHISGKKPWAWNRWTLQRGNSDRKVTKMQDTVRYFSSEISSFALNEESDTSYQSVMLLSNITVPVEKMWHWQERSFMNDSVTKLTAFYDGAATETLGKTVKAKSICLLRVLSLCSSQGWLILPKTQSHIVLHKCVKKRPLQN